MNNEEIRKKEEIESALAAMVDDDFLETSKDLLEVLGYRSDRTANFPVTADHFIWRFPARNRNTDTEQEFLDNVESVELVFQVSSEEIASDDQPMLFEVPTFDEGYVRTFTFFAIELKDSDYPRSKYAQFTREVNKRFIMPVVVFFRVKDRLTIGFVGRRQHRRDPDRDVLEQVTLIKDIRLDNPHRAHLDILFALSLEECAKWMRDHKEQENFDGLLAAWLARLDTEELNKKFYRELFNWFEWAVAEGKFPTDKNRSLDPEEHVIRLITRLLFVWFIKEKGLIADELFNEAQVSPLLKDYDHDCGDSYYRAVLQNLFFATLNTEIGKRKFSKGGNPRHRNFSLYRYKDQITDPDKLLELFEKTPFINGGLFDCLDSEEATRDGGYRIDCFSDVDYDKLRVPNRLFFDRDRGLIPLLEHYKFTVEENTPIEQEVALDPELLGKVFENLLAAYNPETGATARKQTGSYYTPRPIVDYMVEEALVTTLEGKVSPTHGEAKFWDERMRYLFDYAKVFDDANEFFDSREADAVVRVISELKILDPAVGSGAFPMGVLHKLTLALRRLDPDNKRWEALQKERAAQRAADAFDTEDDQARREELLEINETFKRYRDSDFGRKLYLIQNSIFGVDIQSIACQIAKLRFFISLAIEQEPDRGADNFGIKPLPNLETRFIAANTLIGLEEERTLTSPKARDLERELGDNRERHFHATTRPQKLACKREDKKLRQGLAKELKDIGMPTDDAEKIAHWDPYDQNASADWFDSEWMFGVREGFDVVIGNPPYIQLQKNDGELGSLYKNAGYTTFVRTGDIYQLFYEKGCQLLKCRHGLLSYITSNSWLKAKYGETLRRYFSEQHTPLRLLEMGKDVFENAIVDTSILLLREGNSDKVNPVIIAVDMDKLHTKDFPPSVSLWGQTRPDSEKPWSILSHAEHSVMDKMMAKGTLLKDWNVAIYRGVLTGYNKAFLIDNDAKDALIAKDPNSAKIIKPILRGRDIQRYRAKWAGLWLIDTHNGYDDVPAVNIDNYPAIKNHLDRFYPRLEERRDKGRTPYNLRNCAYYKDFAKEKLFWIELVENGRFAYDDSGIYGEATSFIMTGECIKYLCAVLNGELARWFLEQVAPTSGMGTLRWKKIYVEALPIPKISAVKQQPLIQLVDCILATKAADPDADVSDLENEIDQIVYLLYDLTPEEIAIVEGAENV